MPSSSPITEKTKSVWGSGRLVPLADTGAQYAAASERHERMNYLVALVGLVLPWIEEAHETLEAILGADHEQISEGDQYRQGGNQMNQAHPAGKQQHPGHRTENDHGTEIRLPGNQQGEDPQHHEVWYHPDAERLEPLLLLGK